MVAGEAEVGLNCVLLYGIPTATPYSSYQVEGRNSPTLYGKSVSGWPALTQ